MIEKNKIVKVMQTLQDKLEQLYQENAVLKYRLSEMVDNDVNNNFLQKAEYFQSEFLLIDDMLKKISEEYQEVSGYTPDAWKRESLSEKMKLKYNNLNNVLLKLEKKFLNLSEEFNDK